MTEYEIKNKYVIKAGDIMVLTNDVYNTDIDTILPKETIVEVLKATSDKIEVRILKHTMPYFNRTIWIFFNKSPAEDFHFVELIKNLEKLSVPELFDEQIPINSWPKTYLYAYIEFLEIQLDELNT